MANSKGITVLLGCDNLWAFMQISNFLFHCILSLPTSHPSHPRTLRRIRVVAQGTTIAGNGGQRTTQIDK